MKLALKFFTDIQQKQQDIDNNLKRLEEKFSKSINDINTQLHQQTNTIAENAMELEGNGPTFTAKSPKLTDITSALTSILSEEKEKEKRKLNLIVHEVPESTRSIAQERKAHDLDQVHTILKECLGLETTIENPMQLGKKILPKHVY